MAIHTCCALKRNYHWAVFRLRSLLATPPQFVDFTAASVMTELSDDPLDFLAATPTQGRTQI
jgi:hypothetical protein